jgi:diguanylate cyclase (GGDEF)-like protein
MSAGSGSDATTTVGELDLFTLSGEDGRIYESTDSFATLLGHPATELNERRLLDLVHVRDQDLVAPQLAGLSAEREHALECRFLQSDGQPVYVQSVMRPVGDSWRVASIETADFCDLLTERKDLRTRLELAVAPAVAAMWDLEVDGSRFNWDLDAAELLGISADQLPGTLDALVDLVHPADRDGLRSAFARLTSEGHADTALRVTWGESERHLSFRGRVLDHGRVPASGRAVGLLLDITMEKALEEQLLRLSVSDGLTGIRNRRGFDQALRGEWRRCGRDSDPISVVMIDVDHFKRFNDTHGHLIGDQALVAISRALEGVLQREGDTLARYGGEEFAVILPGIGLNAAEVVVARLLDAVERVRLRQTPDWRFSISAGVASARPDVIGAKATELLQAADRALYGAKRAGRGRLLTHGLTPEL